MSIANMRDEAKAMTSFPTMALPAFLKVVLLSQVLLVIGGHSLAKSSDPETDEQRVLCSRGEYAIVGETDALSCHVCRPEHFMDEYNHRHADCKRCTQKEEHITHETIIKNCTLVSDTVLGCVDGYHFDWNHECKACTQCQHKPKTPYVGSPCTTDHNTVCCPSPHMKVMWGEGSHSFKCISGTTDESPASPPSQNCEGTFVRRNGCQEGEHVELQCQTGRDWVSCKPCANNTFMNLSRHNESSCVPCSPPTESDRIIVTRCNLTHNNVYQSQSSSSDKIIGASLAAIFGTVILSLGVYFCCWKNQTARAMINAMFARCTRQDRTDSDPDSEIHLLRDVTKNGCQLV